MISTYFSSKTFTAIIGDIVKSKKLVDRKAIQERLAASLNEINIKYGETIASKFMITLGDEFQGLLHTGNQAIAIIEDIERKMYPIQIRFGIGVGEITTGINPDIPLGADGPAYYHARKMIDELKAQEKKLMVAKSNVRIEIENHAPIADLINAIFSLNTVIKAKWTIRQREIIYAYLKCDRTQSDVAYELGINRTNVQRALSGSHFYAYQQALDKVTKILASIEEKQCV